MAQTLTLAGLTAGGLNYYARFIDSTGRYWRADTSVWEGYNAANVAKYGADSGSATPYNVPVEDGATGTFQLLVPAFAAGIYKVIVLNQAGAAPIQNETFVTGGTFGWNGTEAALNVAATLADGAITAAKFAANAIDANALAATAAQEIADAVEIGVAGGIRTITVTVTSGGNPVQGATAQIKAGSALIDQDTTDEDGIATPTADDGTYTLVVSYPRLYASSTTALVVSADAAVAISLTAISYTPSMLPDTVTVRWTVMSYLTRQPVGLAAATVYMRIKEGPGTDGYIWERGWDSDATDGTGIVEFADVPLGCTVQVRLGADGPETDVAIPLTAVSPYDASELWGAF